MLIKCFILAVLIAFSNGQIYYASNSSQLISDSSCLIEDEELYPCATLETFANKRSLQGNSNASIYFIHKNYSIYENLSISFTSLMMVELRPWKNKVEVNIFCIGDISFTYSRVNKVILDGIQFHNCGTYMPVFTFNYYRKISAEILVANTSFNNTTLGALRVIVKVVQLQVINCSFVKGMKDYGINIKSIYAESVFLRTTFSNNNYGSVYFSSRYHNGSLEFIECTFSNNTSGGVVINSFPYINIYNCLFTQNFERTITVANNYYPLMSPQATIIVNCSIFRNNTAGYGGLLFIKYPYTIQLYNSTFIYNRAMRRDGGVIVIDGVYTTIIEYTSSIEHCTFSSNSASNGRGGVLSISVRSTYGSGASLRVSNSLFYNNSAHVGGALALQRSFATVFYMCNFTENKATAEGGAVYVDGGIAFQAHRCHFLNNYALRGGGAVVENGNKVIVNECSFEQNRASYAAGALNIENLSTNENISAILLACNFTSNQAIEQGGAIKMSKIVQFKVSNSNFNNNSANVGGALLAKTSTFGPHLLPRLMLTGCKFTYNRGNGGALATDGYGVILEASILQWNVAEHLGGAIWVKNGVEVYPWKLWAEGTITRKVWGEVTIISSVLANNSATVGGSMSVTCVGSKIRLSNSSFIANEARLEGGAVVFNLSSPILAFVISNCTFANNLVIDETGRGGAVAILNEQLDNTLSMYSSIYSVLNEQLKISSSGFWSNKASYGGAVFFFNISSFAANCTFMGNMASFGGAVYATFTNLSVKNTIFQANTAAEMGGGVALNISNLNFSGNSKLCYNQVTSKTGKGGGIFVKDRSENCRVDSYLLSWTGNTTVDFTRNSAKIGPMIYGGMMDRCNTSRPSLFEVLTSNGLRYDSATRGITSESVRLCYCENNKSDCEIREIKVNLSPGQTLYLHLACVDQMEQPRTCVIRSEYNGTEFQLGQGQNSRRINDCEKLAYNAYSKEKKNSTLIIHGEILCNESRWNTLKVHVSIWLCPKGFEKIEDRCQCDNRLRTIFLMIECDINTGLVDFKQLGWFSYDGGILRLHENCPLSYCYLVKNGTFPSKPDTQCKNNRGGILCGGCEANHSVVLGSWKCLNCSHVSSYNFIWLTVVIALVGVVLVGFLLLVKMTVSSGTINGLIFYANIISQSGLLDYQNCSVHPILRVFLSWVNLDLGIEACFYSGMDVYQKTWLQFIFPFYLWFLVGVIIVFCHFSVKVMKLMGMRNIEVLATLFLLSYAKLLKTIVTSFSFTDVMVASAENLSDTLVPMRVWLYDGNINFLDYKHLPLFIIALLLLILLFFPYTLLLTFGQCLRSLQRRRILKWTRSAYFVYIMDAYHAPYSHHHRYWIGLCLLIRCILFTLFGISYNIHSNFLWIILAMAFMLTARVCSGGFIYGRKAVDLLEVFFIINLGLLAVLLHHNNTYCQALTASTSVSFALFVCITAFHFHLEMNKNIRAYAIMIEKIRNMFVTKSAVIQDQSVGTEDSEVQSTYINLRESLLL